MIGASEDRVTIVRKSREFIPIHRKSILDKGLSLAARGLHHVLLASGECFDTDAIARGQHENVESLLEELLSAGYIKGSIGGGDIHVLNYLGEPDRKEPVAAPPAKENQGSGFLGTERVPGYIYVLEAQGSGRYKIGQTTGSPQRRIASFRTGCPYPIKLVSQFKVPDVVAAEEQLHKAYQHLRVSGEWFELTEDDLSQIQRLEG